MGRADCESVSGRVLLYMCVSLCVCWQISGHNGGKRKINVRVHTSGCPAKAQPFPKPHPKPPRQAPLYWFKAGNTQLKPFHPPPSPIPILLNPPPPASPPYLLAQSTVRSPLALPHADLFKTLLWGCPHWTYFQPSYDEAPLSPPSPRPVTLPRLSYCLLEVRRWKQAAHNHGCNGKSPCCKPFIFRLPESGSRFITLRIPHAAINIHLLPCEACPSLSLSAVKWQLW